MLYIDVQMYPSLLADWCKTSLAVLAKPYLRARGLSTGAEIESYIEQNPCIWRVKETSKNGDRNIYIKIDDTKIFEKSLSDTVSDSITIFNIASHLTYDGIHYYYSHRDSDTPGAQVIEDALNINYANGFHQKYESRQQIIHAGIKSGMKTTYKITENDHIVKEITRKGATPCEEATIVDSKIGEYKRLESNLVEQTNKHKVDLWYSKLHGRIGCMSLAASTLGG